MTVVSSPRNSNRIYAYKLISLLARTSQRTKSKMIRTTLVSALLRQFDSFFGAIDRYNIRTLSENI